MGQLERYGLYVLCVVIVLILGVAIWGGDTAAAAGGDPLLEQERSKLVTELETSWDPPDPTLGAPAADGGSGPGTGFFEPVASEGIELGNYLSEAAAPASTTAAPPSAVPAGGDAAPATAPARSAGVQTLVTYTVRKGDTMEKIAKAELGDASFVAQIKLLNPDVDPRSMRPGDVLKLPWLEGAARPEKSVAANITQEYEVKRGDTLEAISQRFYNTARHTKLLQEHNKIANPRRLRAGQVLKIPPVQH